MKHYLLTRMNKNYKKLDNPHKWLDERLRLFETYTLPSVKAQSNQNFEWLLFFDEHTPQSYLKYENIVFGDFADNITEQDWTITTRLDNDDMLYPDAIEMIQEAFEEKEMVIGGKNDIFIINDGYYKDTTNPKQTPFLSLIEAPGIKKTVYQRPHTKLHKLYDHKLIDGYIGTHVHHGNNKGKHVERHKGEKL